MKNMTRKELGHCLQMKATARKELEHYLSARKELVEKHQRGDIADEPFRLQYSELYNVMAKRNPLAELALKAASDALHSIAWRVLPIRAKNQQEWVEQLRVTNMEKLALQFADALDQVDVPELPELDDTNSKSAIMTEFVRRSGKDPVAVKAEPTKEDLSGVPREESAYPSKRALDLAHQASWDSSGTHCKNKKSPRVVIHGEITGPLICTRTTQAVLDHPKSWEPEKGDKLTTMDHLNGAGGRTYGSDDAD